MSGTGKAGNADQSYMTSVWEWAADLASESGHAIRYTLATTERKGVFLIRAQVIEVCDGRALSVVLQQEEVWPNPQKSTLAGALFALQLRLDETYSRLKGQPLGL